VARNAGILHCLLECTTLAAENLRIRFFPVLLASFPHTKIVTIWQLGVRSRLPTTRFTS
jgi:hypothetical protein